MEKTIHHGRNIKRFREMLGIKQDALAIDLGLTQQAISNLEQKEVIDDKILSQVASILKVPEEAIRNFDEEKAINFISSTFNDHAALIINNMQIHPMEMIVSLHKEKISLYERMLKEKDDMINRMERLLEGGK
jgi:transcriptional regulator with XRE-family HTH domain